MVQVNLNEKQKEAVEFNNGDLLIIAGAGTGKTSVLTQRIIYLLNEDKAKASEMLALTFTEKAANEMQERIDLAMSYGYDEVWVSTFHAFCDRILKQDGYHIGLDADYSLMTTAQSYIFLRKHMFDVSLDKFRPYGNPTRFLNDLLKHFSRLQDEDVAPQDYVEFAKTLPKGTVEEKEKYEEAQELAKVYEEYTDLKIKNSKIDFGDLIILTLRLFREKPNVLEKYRKQFKYILVDEFQDTNFTQNVLVNLLVLGSENSSETQERPQLTVVGDDDQAIYKFRGAAISNILQFKEIYPDAKEIVLVENYRSRQEILDKSHDLIEHNNPNRLEVTEKIDKRLEARRVFKNEDNDAVQFVSALNEDAEAEWITSEILKLTGHDELSVDVENTQAYDEKGQSSFVDKVEDEESYKFSDIAILVRANSHSESIVQNLRYAGIPFKLGGSRGLYFREEIKNLIAFLMVLTDYKYEMAMYRLLAMDVWNVSPREYMELNRLARESKISLLEQLEKMWDVKIGEEKVEISDGDTEENNMINKILSQEAIVGVSNLLMLLDYSVKRVKDNRSIGEILYDFFSDSGYKDSFLMEESPENEFAISNIQKFFELVKAYEKDNPDSNVYEYVDYLNYCIDVGESPLVDQIDLEDINAVNILTVHGSKGLEFPIVFLSNLVSERFPSTNRSDVIPIPEELIKEAKATEISEKEAHIQEERRLFYVGATRAQERLYLTAANYYGNGKRKKKPSAFLYEILDKEVLEEFNLDEKDIVKKEMDVFREENQDSLLPKDMKLNIAKKISYSQLNVYTDCPRKYEYAYVLKVPQRPSAALSFGTTVHNALRVFYEDLKKSKEGLGILNPPTKEDLLAYYEKYWIGVGYESSDHEKKRKIAGQKLMEEYFDNVYSSDEQPYLLEEGFSVHIGGSVFNGKIDRLDLVKTTKDGTKEVVLIDYKTGKVKKPADIKKDLQLPLYAEFAEQKLGVKVVEARYVFVEHAKGVSVDVSQERREKAKELIPEFIENLENRNFKATPGFGCRFCDYNSVCKYAEL